MHDNLSFSVGKKETFFDTLPTSRFKSINSEVSMAGNLVVMLYIYLMALLHLSFKAGFFAYYWVVSGK